MPWFGERILVRMNIPCIRLGEEDPEFQGEILTPSTQEPWGPDLPFEPFRSNIFVYGWRGKEVEGIPCMDPVMPEFLYMINRKQYAQFLQ